MKKLDADKTGLLKRNAKLEPNLKAQGFDLNGQITKMKDELAEEKKQIKEWRPHVNLAIKKLNNLFPSVMSIIRCTKA